MPIDDVDYLKKNSIKQNILFIIDSKDRDHVAYPTPSSYTIDLTIPFYNVIGFQLIEASIPRTMYNVDIYNNTLSFFIHDSEVNIQNVSRSNYVGADGSRTLDTGDYTIQSLIVALNGTVNNDPTMPILLGMNVNNDPNKPYTQITAKSLSNPPELKNIIQFSCPYPFVIDMGNSTIAETLGFDLVVQPGYEGNKPILEQRYTAIPPPLMYSNVNDFNYLYHSVDIPPNIALGNTYIAFQGPTGVVRNLSISTCNYVAQSFQVIDDAYLTQVNAALFTPTTNQGVAVNQIAEWAIYNDYSNQPNTLLHTYTYNSITQQYDIPHTSNAISVNTINGGYSFTNNPFQLYLTPGTYWIVMTSSTDNLATFYNDVPTYQNYQPLLYLNSNITGLASNIQGYTWLSKNDNENGVYFQASIQVMLQNTYHYLTAPGIYSLFGDRYITIRCPEIEQYAFRSFAYTKESLGIARIKLGVVGYSEYSGDFSSIPLREFHPVGKVPKLTFNFQRQDGTVYDFKGVNHTMTFAIYYYEPIQINTFEHSILNPNYNPNFIQYMENEEGEEDDSDDQEEDFNRDAVQNYRLVEARHLPETIAKLDQEALYRFSLNNNFN
jgi:hypothetical protein